MHENKAKVNTKRKERNTSAPLFLAALYSTVLCIDFQAPTDRTARHLDMRLRDVSLLAVLYVWLNDLEILFNRE